MEQIILVVHLLVALAIIGLIMLQQGKGADMGASFGAGASQTLLGSSGSANVLTRATAWLVVLFFASSFGLALLANKQSAVSDELDLDIPEVMDVREQAADQELPVVEQDVPVMEQEVPTEAGKEGDVPSLD